MNVAKLIAGLFKKKEAPAQSWSKVVYKDGKYLYVGIYSNQFKDREGDIAAEQGHIDYMAWLKTSGFRPYILPHHLPLVPGALWEMAFKAFGDDGEKLNRFADALYKDHALARTVRAFYLNGFAFVVGEFLPGREGVAKALAARDDVGMSHGFFSILNGSTIEAYRSFEFSVLRREAAANAITLGGPMKMTLTAEDRKFLTDLMGEEGVKELEGSSADAQKALQRIVDYKSTEAAPADPPAVEAAQVAAESAAPVAEAPEVNASALMEAVVKALNLDELRGVLAEMNSTIQAQAAEIKALKDRIEDQGAVVKAVAKTQDETVAELIMPRLNWKAAATTPSASPDNIVGAEVAEQLIKSGPQGEPKPDAQDPLALGLYSMFPQARA